MTAIAFHPADTYRAAGARPAWPWLSTLLLSLAFFLAAHGWNASQKWQRLLKGEVASMAAEEADGRVSRQVGFLLLGAVGAALLVSGPGVQVRRPATLLLFTFAALLVWALLSAAWSADVAVTLKRQIVLVCMLLGTLGIVRRFEIERISEIAFVHALLVLIVGVAAELILAQRGHPGEEYRFAGTLHPNHAGINASLLLLCSLFLAHHKADWRFLCVAAVAVVVLLMTKSRTALLAAIAGTAAFVALAWPARQKLALMGVLALAGSIGLALVASDALPHLTETLLLNRKSSDPMTLTGRTMIWQFAWSHVSEDWGRIVAGFGYGGFWTRATAEALSQRAHFNLSEGHNAYLDVLLQLGVVGLFFYVCGVVGALGISLAGAIRDHAAASAFAAALIVFSLVHHFAESAMTAPTFPTLILWAVVGSVALRPAFSSRTGRGI